MKNLKQLLYIGFLLSGVLATPSLATETVNLETSSVATRASQTGNESTQVCESSPKEQEPQAQTAKESAKAIASDLRDTGLSIFPESLPKRQRINTSATQVLLQHHHSVASSQKPVLEVIDRSCDTDVETG